MKIHSATESAKAPKEFDLKEVSAMVFPGEGEGVSPILVEYVPVPGPILLRDHPTRRYAYIYQLIPMGGGQMARGPLLSASIVDVAQKN